MSHIEKCRQLYYATLKVPVHLREQLGRTKFKQSLGTGDKRRAQELAKPVVALWKARLRQASGEPDAVQQEALRWRESLAVLRRTEESAGVDDGPSIEVEGLVTDRAHAIEAKRGPAAAREFAGVALGTATPSRMHYDEWAASIIHLQQKTQDQYKADVSMLCKRFQTLEAMTPQALRLWVDDMASRAVNPMGHASVKRMVSCWRSYWSFLEGIEAVPAGSKPFALVKLPAVKARASKGKGKTPTGWLPFPAADVPKLWQAAEVGGDEGRC